MPQRYEIIYVKVTTPWGDVHEKTFRIPERTFKKRSKANYKRAWVWFEMNHWIKRVLE